jgi:hypothetical protein
LRRTHVFYVLAVVIGLLCSAGCNSGDTGASDVTPAPVEDRIKAIESRTDMPPQAKAMAIQQLRGREAASTQGAGAVKPK